LLIEYYFCSGWLTFLSSWYSCFCMCSINICMDTRPRSPRQAWQQCWTSSFCPSTWGRVHWDDWGRVHDKGSCNMHQEYQWVSTVSDCFIICTFWQITTVM